MLSGALQADADVESGGTYSVSTMSLIGRHLMLIEIYLCVGVWVWVWVGGMDIHWVYCVRIYCQVSGKEGTIVTGL